MPIRCRIAPLGTIGLLVIGTSALAGVQYQVNFESYSLGKLDGQHNWFQYDGDAPPATVSVQNSVVRPLTGGAQAVEFRVNGPAPNSFQNFTDVWSTDSSVSAEQIAIEPIVTIQWDMMRSPLEGGTIGTGVWGIDIYDSDDTHLAASIGAWDDPFGPAVGGTDGLGDWVFLGDGSVRGGWDTYTVQVNYVTRTYTLAVNGVAAGGPLALLNEADAGIGDIDFLALTRGTDTGYFDNFSISTSIVPEPAWIAAIPALAAWVMRRRHGTKVSQVGLPSTLRKPSGEPGNSRMGQYWSSN